jgi:hypothetical protein
MSRSNGFDSLSRSGAARRDEILRLAKQTARARREKRRRAALVAANSAFVVIAIISAMLIRQFPGPTLRERVNSVAIAPRPAPPVAAPRSVVQIIRIETDPTLLDRLSVHPTPRWQSLTDDELIQAFAEAGQQVGIIHADGQTILMTR